MEYVGLLWQRKNGHPDILAVWLYDTATIKQIRDAAESHRKEEA